MKRFAILVTFITLCSLAFSADFKWEEPQAIVTETGAIKWNPKPLVEDFSGQDLRYIDYENGSDKNDGKSPESAWKHHPWDYFAVDNAKVCSGVKTYIFKRGVYYRGQLNVQESGAEGSPIRLTSSEKWGEGKASLVGSKRLPSQWVKSSEPNVDAPERLSEKDKVWALKIGQMEWWNNGRPGYRAGRGMQNRPPVKTPFIGLFAVQGNGDVEWLHLARDPDWQKPGNEFAHDYWHSWDGNGKPMKNDQGEEYFSSIGPYKGPAQDDHLKGKPDDFFTGAIVWNTYPSLMGTATPMRQLNTKVTHKKTKKSGPAYDAETGTLALLQFHGFSKGTRYKIENLPQYLDAAGEFYLMGDKQDAVLFYRPGGGRDPNEMHIELVINDGHIKIEDQSHIEISGLQFQFCDGTAIPLFGSCEDINIHHNIFRHQMKHCIYTTLKPDQEKWNQRRDPADWRLDLLTDLIIADNSFSHIWDRTMVIVDASSYQNQVRQSSISWPWGRLGHVEILRNRLEDVGIRHQGSRYSAIPAINLNRAPTGIVAGNVIRRSFGSGILVHGGNTRGFTGADWPLTRILIYHNSTEDTALAVNDYGGFSLWQGGQIYAYNNNIGNSTGYMPGGIFGNGRPVNLSYPYYIDGGYKIYGFNNIVWDRSNDPQDPYSSNVAGYFSVFGFLNHFTNNTLFRHARATGGSSGNRTDIISNVFADISKEFLKNNRVENPSLVGGGDTGASGIAGIPSLAYGKNIFSGEAIGGSLVETNERKGVKVHQNIAAPTIEKMREQMQSFPVRWGDLGEKVDACPIVGELEENGLTEKGAEAADFRLTEDSPAIDAGARYFISWALGATVGEWNFTENRADPTVVTDYALYMSEAHFQRFMYNQVPTLNLKISKATLSDYVESPSEDWVNGAVAFDGARYAVVTDADMREDIKLDIRGFITGGGQRSWSTWNKSVNKDVWKLPEPEGGYEKNGNPNYGEKQVARYPGERRNTLISTTRNLLLEAKFKADNGDAWLMGKHDGQSGYALVVNGDGKAEFRISSGGKDATVTSAKAVNDGEWHHVLAEVDRKSGRMTIYVDGKKSAESKATLAPGASLDCKADFVVGKSSASDANYLKGAVDFMRVCHSTLEESLTSIEELYAWQYVSGPALFDMRGEPVKGERRDAGALELK